MKISAKESVTCLKCYTSQTGCSMPTLIWNPYMTPQSIGTKWTRYSKPNAKNPQGGIVEQEAPIHISNLQVLDPKSGKATRVGRKAGENGKLVRYAKKSGEEIK